MFYAVLALVSRSMVKLDLKAETGYNLTQFWLPLLLVISNIQKRLCSLCIKVKEFFSPVSSQGLELKQ